MRRCWDFEHPDQAMNEYLVTLRIGELQWTKTVQAETAARARDDVENTHDAEIISVKFVRALGFSGRIRGTVR
jgi:hypothetical protein